MSPTAELVEAYRAATGAVQTRVGAQAAATWLTMTSWSDAAADEFLSRVVPLVLAGQRQTATMTAAYVGRATGSPIQRLDVDAFIGAAVRNGADLLEVYSRAVREARVVYNRSDLVELAVNRGLQQLLGTVQMDLQLAGTHAARAAMSSAGVEQFRVITRPGACPLCVASSDRVYSTDQLRPVHTHCHCVTVPGAKVPKDLQGKGLRSSREFDPEKDIGERKVAVDFNDEIGPVLTYEDDLKRLPKRKGGGGTSVGMTRETITPQQAIDLKRRQVEANQAAIDGGANTPHMQRLVAGLRDELAAMEAALELPGT
jgi:hypothetical protein